MPRLPRSPVPASSPQAQPEPHVDIPARRQESPIDVTNQAGSRATLKCNSCGHITTNERRMANHIRNMHTNPQMSGPPMTLLVGDSHLNSLNLPLIERGLGRGARLFAPGATRPREDRAYCSTPDWPGARYPQNSQQQMVPELLGERKYTNLIVMAPTSDITNLKDIKSKHERERLAAQSAKNTVRLAEQALNSVNEVLIMEQPVRVDMMADLSHYSKTKLREFVQASQLASKIKIGSSRPDILTSEAKKAEVFGKPSDRKADGIHMRGVKGKQFLSETFIEAVKFTGLADRDSRLGRGSQSAQGLDGQEQGWTRVVGGPRPSLRMEAHRSWADVANNQFNSLLN